MQHMFRFLALGTALLASQAMAGAREELKTFTTGLKGLDGQFTQQVHDASGKLKESSSGRVALSVPRLFRWEYTKPYPQLIVADGSKVWVYEPDLEQATVRGQGEEEQNSPLTALINQIKAIDPSYDNIAEREYFAYVNYGYELLREGNCTAAKQQFETALALRPGGEEAQMGLRLLNTYCATPVPPTPATMVPHTPPCTLARLGS